MTAAAFMAAPTSAPAQQKTLRVVALNHPFVDAMADLIPEFEKETGLKVNLETYGEDQLSQKLTTEFTAGHSTIDVFATRPQQEARIMHRNKWYTDLAPYIAKTEGYDWNDFTDSAHKAVTFNGFIIAVPTVNECQVVYYRADLLAAKGLAVPKTITELYAAAEKLTDRDNDLYGIVMRGQRAPLVTQFSSFLYSYGGDFFDAKTNKATINTPQALAAMDMYGRLLRNFGPDGVLNMSWPQAAAIFAQGKAAFWVDASSLYMNVLDPKKSAVAAHTKVAPFPAGPKGARMYNVSPWALAISAASQQKDEAWKFVEFMTNKKSLTFMQGQRNNQGPRKSVWASPEGTKNFDPSWIKAVAAAADGVPYDRPLIAAVSEARDYIGEVVVAAIEGQDYRKTAQASNERFQKLLDREK